MISLLLLVFRALTGMARTRAAFAAKNAVLRHQLSVVGGEKKRPGYAGRFFSPPRSSLTFWAVLAFGSLIIRNAGQFGAGWEGTVLTMPVIGVLYDHLFTPTTYYATDTRLMFQESVHRAVGGSSPSFGPPAPTNAIERQKEVPD